MATIYLITRGEYSDYYVDSVWTEKVQAEKVCALLNKGTKYGGYQVEEHPLDCLHDERTLGFVATYDYKNLGYPVAAENVIVEEVIFTNSVLPTDIDGTGNIRAESFRSADVARKSVFDKAAELHAVEQGITEGINVRDVFHW